MTKNKFIQFCLLAAICFAGVVFNACKNDDSTPEIVRPNDSTNISIPENLWLAAGESHTLEITPLPKNTTKAITWQSSNASIATVDSTGKVTAIKKGTATITAQAGGKPAVCEVTVDLPMLSTGKVTNITDSTATFNGTIINVGKPAYIEKGFCYSTAPNPTIKDSTKIIVTGTEKGEFSANVTKLKYGTVYYVKAYAINAQKDTVYGKQIIKPTVKLNTSSLIIAVGEKDSLKILVTPADTAAYKVEYASSNTSVAIIDAYSGKITAKTKGHATITATTPYSTTTCKILVYEVSTEENVPINGTIWATCNADIKIINTKITRPNIVIDTIIAFATAPESYGKLYQWNRKVWLNTTDATVKNWNVTIPQGTKWEKANDPCPEGYRIPTQAEMDSLIKAVNVVNMWKTYKNVAGRVFVDKITGNALFLPAVGCRNYSNGSLYAAGTHGFYWSSTPYESDATGAYRLRFNQSGAGVSDDCRRDAYSIRPVLAQ
ncbi:MAG: Ig-like domain-containing protein [Bacteroidetes bacterium]|nr:Ig-like domain-containing protein [Bacteroidota bacterium]